MPTLASSCVQVILRLARSVNTPSEHFLERCSDIGKLIKDGSRLDITEASRLIAAITEESGESDIGLHSYDLFHPGQLNSQLYAIMSSATLGEALRTVQKFSVLLSDGAPIEISDELDSFCINFLELESLDVTRQYIDCCLSTMIGLTHWLLPWEKPMPTSATFSYPEPEDLTRLESIFGHDLIFSHHVNKITFSLVDWLKPLATANPALRLYHYNHSQEELSKHQHGITFLVKNHIRAGLVKGNTVSLESVASKMYLSTRTLQHRLEDEGTGFRPLMDECRKYLAEQLLLSSNDTISSIAEKLNFREPSSFHKAFNRWFGCPPKTYRYDKLQ